MSSHLIVLAGLILAIGVGVFACSSQTNSNTSAIKPAAPEQPAKTTPTSAKLEPKFNLHTPDYGPLLKRGAGVVEFEILDKLGQVANIRWASVELYRHLGKFTLLEDAAIDYENNRIVCDGYRNGEDAGVGLEAGRYTIQIKTRRWGSFQHEFEISAGEHLFQQLKTQRYERRVSLLLVDNDGEPIPFINELPNHWFSNDKLKELETSWPADWFLKDQPGVFPNRGGSGGYSSGPHYPPKRHLLRRTDGGRWWFDVVAGAENQIVFYFDSKVWGQSSVRYTSDFLDETKRHVVVVNVPDAFSYNINSFGDVDNSITPGDKTVLPRTKRKPKKETKNKPLPSSITEYLTFPISAKKLPRTVLAAGRTIVFSVKSNHWRGRNISTLKPVGGEFEGSLIISAKPTYKGNGYNFYSSLTKIETACQRNRNTPQRTVRIPRASGREDHQHMYVYSDWIDIEGDRELMLASLESGALSPEISGLLALRAVGKAGEGLPWVQGVIVDWADDAVAQEVRAKTADKSPEMLVELADEHRSTMDELVLDFDVTKLRKTMGDEAFGWFDTDAQRLWFGRHGAWYDTGRKVYSDEHGYVLTREQQLEAGKKYVLYLWSNSRDDQAPDRRIVFEAGKENADLGVIELPSYK